MQGVLEPSAQKGIIPRAFEHIFESVQCAENAKFLVRASYLEIYNEDIHDLLGADTKHKLELKEHPEKGVYVKGLSLHTVHSVVQCEQLMETGCSNRAVGYTLMNKDSSRSHAVFTVNMEICTVADNNYDESLSTLRYANRAKNIKNKPCINEDPKDTLLREYQEEIKKLKAILAEQMGMDNLAGLLHAETAHLAVKSPPLFKTQVELEAEKQLIREEYNGRLAQLKASYEAEQASRARLEEDISRLKTHYDLKLSALEENFRKEAGVDVEGVSQAEGSLLTETASGEPPLPKDTVAAVDEEPAPVQVRLRLLLTRLNKPEWVMPMLWCLLFSEMQLLVSSCPQDPAAPQTVQDTGGVSRRSAATGMAVTAEGMALSVDQQQVLARLQVLERQVVGGEQAKNKDLKEKHRRRKRYADERRMQLVAALQQASEDSSDWVLLTVYDSIHEEVRAKSRLLEKMQRRLQAAETEIKDLQLEFELEKIDYLSTIRRLERDLMLNQQLLDQVQLLVRRDCNYSNLERMKRESIWDEETGCWKIPEPVIHKIHLPAGNRSVLMVLLGSEISLVYRESAWKVCVRHGPFGNLRALWSGSGVGSTRALTEFLTPVSSCNSSSPAIIQTSP
uniref:Uncharacterized protein n=1 Tax=Melopsittacus undulatus TaxID=13146 RepID=A0A8V5H734_MELUD